VEVDLVDDRIVFSRQGGPRELPAAPPEPERVGVAVTHRLSADLPREGGVEPRPGSGDPLSS
jgi:hypothetical protein